MRPHEAGINLLTGSACIPLGEWSFPARKFPDLTSIWIMRTNHEGSVYQRVQTSHWLTIGCASGPRPNRLQELSDHILRPFHRVPCVMLFVRLYFQHSSR